jgi:hypothetical protein
MPPRATFSLSSFYILMECLSHSSPTGEEFLHHLLYLSAETGVIKVKAEHVFATVELAQAAPVLIGLAYL